MVKDVGILLVKSYGKKSQEREGFFYLQASYKKGKFKVKKHCSRNFYEDEPAPFLKRGLASVGSGPRAGGVKDKSFFSLFGPTFINANWQKSSKYIFWQFKLHLQQNVTLYEAYPSRIVSKGGEEILFRLIQEGRLGYSINKDKAYQLTISQKIKGIQAYLSISYKKINELM